MTTNCIEFVFSSSSIKWCKYNTISKELFVQFTGGDIYKYYAVPQTIIDKMITASSIGYLFIEGFAS